jgi:hypothetical protein
VLTSLLGLLPSLWWNAAHEWATFRHVSATVQGGSGQQASGNPLEFLASQAALLSPVLFILFALALWQWWKQRKQLPPTLFFCGWVTSISLGMGIFLSLFQKMQGNWMSFAYPTGGVILAWSIAQSQAKITWTKAGLGLSLGLMTALFSLPTLFTHPDLMAYAPPYRLNAFKHNMGWEALAPALTKHGYDPQRHFLVSDKYQTTSLLSFYAPEQKRAYFLNLQGVRNNQFSYWPSLQTEQQGQTGYFVWVENAPHLKRQAEDKRQFYLSELRKYFETVEFVDLASLIEHDGETVKAAMLLRCQNCQPVELERSPHY